MCEVVRKRCICYMVCPLESTDKFVQKWSFLLRNYQHPPQKSIITNIYVSQFRILSANMVFFIYLYHYLSQKIHYQSGSRLLYRCEFLSSHDIE